MKLYRHYKNKFYRLLGTVRHSETLEEMEYYECLYPNELGQAWVRPKELFHGLTDVDGKTVTRFVKVPLSIKSISEINSDCVQLLKSLSFAIFGNNKNSDLEESISGKVGLHLFLAEVDGEVVGYKMGYRLDDGTFYSWLGGVLPAFQRLGIASDLMNAQHEWCRGQGYKKVQTKTGNQFPQMMILNIRSGFHVTGAHASQSDGKVRIIMEKTL